MGGEQGGELRCLRGAAPCLGRRQALWVAPEHAALLREPAMLVRVGDEAGVTPWLSLGTTQKDELMREDRRVASRLRK